MHCGAKQNKACNIRVHASNAGALRSIAGAGKGFDSLSPLQIAHTKALLLQGFFVSGVWDSPALDSLRLVVEKPETALVMELNKSVPFSLIHNTAGGS